MGRVTNCQLQSDIQRKQALIYYNIRNSIPQSLEKKLILKYYELSQFQMYPCISFHNLLMDTDSSIDDPIYIDWTPPQDWKGKNRKKHHQQSINEPSTEQIINQTIEGILQMIQSNDKEQNLNQISLFQPDTTINQYANELTYLQEDPQVQTIKKTPPKLETSKHLQKQQRIYYFLKMPPFEVVLQCKPFSELKADLLFIPFRTDHLQYYPGTILQSQLTHEMAKLKTANIDEGGIYIKNNHRVENFRYLLFIKIGKEISKNLMEGLDLLLWKRKNSNLKITSFVFCVNGKDIQVVHILLAFKNSLLRKNVGNPLTLEINVEHKKLMQTQKKIFQNFH